MSDQTVYTRAPAAALEQAIAAIPQGLATGGAVADAMMTRIGLAVLARIKKAFVAKARGGTDEAGERWAPLSPRTVAYSKTRMRGKGGRTKTEKGRDARPSQALNKRQAARWWELYRQGLGMFRGDKGSAARRAWAILKREGATTLLQKYGGRRVEILRDTGLLLNSLSPGVASAEQVFRVGRGAVIVGTNRKGALAHHRGVPGRLPQRRLWPAPARWPESWWRDIRREVKRGMVAAALAALRGAG